MNTKNINKIPIAINIHQYRINVGASPCGCPSLITTNIHRNRSITKNINKILIAIDRNKHQWMFIDFLGINEYHRIP